jgi:hypothetical protein
MWADAKRASEQNYSEARCCEYCSHYDCPSYFNGRLTYDATCDLNVVSIPKSTTVCDKFDRATVR